MPLILRRFLSDFYTRSRRMFWLCLGLGFLGALSEGIGLVLLLPILQVLSGDVSGRIMTRVQDTLQTFGLSTPSEQLIALISVFLLLVIVRNITSWLRSICTTRLSLEYVDKLRGDVFQAMTRAAWTDLLSLDRAQGQHAVLQDVQRISAGAHVTTRGMVSCTFLIVQLAISLWVSPALTAVALGILAVLGMMLPTILRRSRRIGQAQTVAGRALHEAFGQFLASIKLIKITGNEDDHIQLFQARTSEQRHAMLRIANDFAATQAILQTLSAFLVCGIILIGVFALEVPLPVLATVVLILARASGPMFGLVQSGQTMANLLPAYAQITDLIASLGHSTAQNIPHPPSPPITGAMGVTFDRVSFGYSASMGPQIENLSATLQPGGFAALIGPSGSGKTTVLDLLTGLLSPDSGQVLVAGQPVQNPAHRAAIRLNIGYVPQDPMLLDMSVRDNLTWGQNALHDAQIHDALTQVGAQDLVARLPQGLDSMIGDRGQRLSGGERQRLCLARALLRSPGLLILDEATSALDRRSEAEIIERLTQFRGRLTLILVTHRQINAENFDEIISLNSDT